MSLFIHAVTSSFAAQTSPCILYMDKPKGRSTRASARAAVRAVSLQRARHSLFDQRLLRIRHSRRQRTRDVTVSQFPTYSA